MITASNILEILEKNPVIREHLWRVCGIRIASQLLVKQPEYQVSKYNHIHWSHESFSVLKGTCHMHLHLSSHAMDACVTIIYKTMLGACRYLYIRCSECHICRNNSITDQTMQYSLKEYTLQTTVVHYCGHVCMYNYV